MNQKAASRLDGSPEVAVIGAGIIGIASAVCLQDEGYRVVLIERNDVAKGASFGNAGAFAFSDVLPLASPGIIRRVPQWLLDPLGPLTIRPSYLPTIAPWLVRFWRASWRDRLEASTKAQITLMRLAVTQWHSLTVAKGLVQMVHSGGALELYESENELRASLPSWGLRADAGIEFQHLKFNEIDALQPGLSPRFKAATYVPGWKTVADPYELALALADRFRARGGQITRGTVISVSPSNEAVQTRLNNNTSFQTAKAVIACGAWSAPLAAGLGDNIPLETERGYNTTLPVGSFDVRRQLTFGGHGFVITPLSTGIRIGGAVEFGGLDAQPNFRRSEVMLNKASQFLPGLKTDGGKQWMGFRPSLPDSLPVIGLSKATPNVVYAFGHGHLGLTQAAATGSLVADLVARRRPAIDLTAFRPTRF
jgi:D-amino-acid dehydrogenase